MAASAASSQTASQPVDLDGIALVDITSIGAERAAELRALIRDVPDYPHPPILFRDITGLLADGRALHDVIEAFAQLYANGKTRGGHPIDLVAAMEARGFIFGAPLAVRLGVGFVPLRKAGKLPPPVHVVAYDLEYGTAAIECRAGTIPVGANVLIVDDILATGGTSLAAIKLVESLGGKVSALAFLMELTGLGGREKLAGREVDTLLAAAG